MTTDWNTLIIDFRASPYYYTENMKDCYIYDNPAGYSIRELMLIFDTTADEIMQRFDRGLSKYKYVYRKKGGRVRK